MLYFKLSNQKTNQQKLLCTRKSSLKIDNQKPFQDKHKLSQLFQSGQKYKLYYKGKIHRERRNTDLSVSTQKIKIIQFVSRIDKR